MGSALDELTGKQERVGGVAFVQGSASILGDGLSKSTRRGEVSSLIVSLLLPGAPWAKLHAPSHVARPSQQLPARRVCIVARIFLAAPRTCFVARRRAVVPAPPFGGSLARVHQLYASGLAILSVLCELSQANLAASSRPPWPRQSPSPCKQPSRPTSQSSSSSNSNSSNSSSSSSRSSMIPSSQTSPRGTPHPPRESQSRASLREPAPAASRAETAI